MVRGLRDDGDMRVANSTVFSSRFWAKSPVSSAYAISSSLLICWLSSRSMMVKRTLRHRSSVRVNIVAPAAEDRRPSAGFASGKSNPCSSSSPV